MYDISLDDFIMIEGPIDYRDVSLKAGLNRSETDHFLEGVAGEHESPLALSRDAYDQLQRELETTVLAHERAPWDEYPYELWYLTHRPPTPFYRPLHSRRQVVERGFECGGEGPRACSVFTLQGLRETKAAMTPDQIEAFRAILKTNITGKERPSVSMTRRDFETRADEDSFPRMNFFALSSAGDRAPLAFHAPQSSPSALSEAPGIVLFGSNVEEMIAQVWHEYQRNVRNFGARKILKLLGRRA